MPSIDLSERIAPIVKKARSVYGGEAHGKLIVGANGVWQFPYKEGKVAISGETLLYGKDGKGSAEVRLAKGGSGLWMFSHAVTLPNQGYGVPLSVFATMAFTTRDEALEAGMAAVRARLQRVINGSPNGADRKAADMLSREMEKSRQYTLFR